MKINDIVNAAVEELEKAPEIVATKVVGENKGDVNTKLLAALAKTRRAIIVGWNGFDAETSSSRTIYGKSNLVVAVFEQPTINRKDAGAPTLLELAQTVANTLNLFAVNGMESPLVFRRISPIQELDDKTISCDVVFETKATL